MGRRIDLQRHCYRGEENRFVAAITPSQASNGAIRTTFCHPLPLNIAQTSLNIA